MHKGKLIAIALGGMFLWGACPATAGNFEDPAIYFAVRGYAGDTEVKDKVDPAGDKEQDVSPKGFGAAVGTDLAGTPLRVELEYTRMAKMKYFNDTAKVTMDNIMLNVMLDMPYEECCPPTLRPYVFAGFGMSLMKYKNTTVGKSDDDRPWAVQAGAGIDIALAPSMFVELRGRYFQNFKPDDFNVVVKSMDFVFGVRFNMY